VKRVCAPCSSVRERESERDIKREIKRVREGEGERKRERERGSEREGERIACTLQACSKRSSFSQYA
jgi:hypothetical protein